MTQPKGIHKIQYPIEIFANDIPSMGWITIDGCGGENLYFTIADGTKYFCKCL